MRLLLTVALVATTTGCAFVSQTDVDAQKARFDADGDGAVSIAEGGDDCDDGDATVFPGADEACNGIDDNCDGVVDEDLTEIVYEDADGDGIGSDEPVEICSGFISDSQVFISGDCDDDDATAAPGLVEVPCDGVDNDCDGDADNIDPTETFYVDNDGDGYGDPDRPVLSCDAGAALADNPDDCDDNNFEVAPNRNEVCNAVDNNCNGVPDDGAIDATTWYRDDDADGVGGTITVEACQPPNDGNFWTAVDGDCDDDDDDTYPGAEELCDSADNDCDLEIDETRPNWWPDADEDGFGDEGAPATSNCDPPSPTDVTNNNDCDDGADTTFPGADELCDLADNDCDGTVDEDDAVDAPSWYTDSDSDTYGDPDTEVRACDNPGGLVDNPDDCDDSDTNINPDTVWYADTDDDSFGDADNSQVACEGPADHVLDDTDCDDTETDVNPSVTEICDTIDNNCDEQIDEDLTTRYFEDTDADGFGNAEVFVDACTAPTGFVTSATDCDDQADHVFPGATEACDDVSDYDCDTVVDWDRDGDGFSDVDCTPGGGSDCDDDDILVFPGSGCAEPDCWAWLNEQGETADGLYDIDPDGVGGNAPFEVWCDMTRNGGGWTLLFEDVFDGGADSSWSDTGTSSCLGETILGGYDQFGDDDTVGVTIDGLAVAHDVLWVEAELYQVDSWDDEGIFLDIDGSGVFADNWHHRDGTSNTTCGNPGKHGDNAWGEAVWPYDWMISHTESSDIDLDFSSDTNDEGPTNESWGVDNLAVWVNRFPTTSPGSSDTDPALSCAHVLAADAGASNGPYWIDPDGPGDVAPMQLDCEMNHDGGGWTIIFFDDMNPPDPGWNDTSTVDCGAWNDILGGRNNAGRNNPLEIEVDTFGIPHAEARIEFDYFYIDTWDSADDSFLDLEDKQVWDENHINGANDQCGGSNPDGTRQDQSVVRRHGRPEVSLTFRTDADEGLANESMAIDDVEVWIR